MKRLLLITGFLFCLFSSNAFAADTQVYGGFNITNCTNGKCLDYDTTLNNATGNETAYELTYTTNKATSGDDYGLVVNMTDTASPGTSFLLDLQVNGTSQFNIKNTGKLTTKGSIYFDNTVGSVYTSNNYVLDLQIANASGTSNLRQVRMTSGTDSATAGTRAAVSIEPVYNQSGTAAAYDLMVARTETALGSGTQRFASFGTGGWASYVEKWGVDNKGVEAHSEFDYSATPVAPTRATRLFLHTRALAADTNNACGNEDDCLCLPIPTTMGYLEIWTGGSLWYTAICVAAGTCTEVVDGGAGIEYTAAIAGCVDELCPHDAGTQTCIFNDTAGVVVTTVRFTYD